MNETIVSNPESKNGNGKKFTSADLIDRLRSRFSPPKYILVEQLAPGTGYVNEHIDAAVISVWPSIGIEWMAFEVKVTRNDFLRELRNPRKNDWSRDLFHSFWYIAPQGIIKEEELPEGTGLMVTHGNRLKTIRHAARKKKVDAPEKFIAAFAREVVNQTETAYKAGDAETLKRSEVHQTAVRYKEAVDRFLRSRNNDTLIDHQIDSIVKALEDATIDSQSKKDREVALRAINKFQSEIAGVVDIMLGIAYLGLLARDEVGNEIVGSWGGIDDGQFHRILEMMKDRKQRHTTLTQMARLRNLLNDPKSFSVGMERIAVQER